MGHLKLLELHTRVLLVFSWDCRRCPLPRVLQGLFGIRWKDRQCWASQAPLGAYSAEYLAFAQRYLFQSDGQAATPSRSYLRLDPNVHNQVFGNFVALDYDVRSKPAQPRPSMKAFCPANPGVELFISETGAGVLSLTFRLGEGDTPLVTFDGARQFNYALSQSGRKNIPYLRRPHPDLDPHFFSDKVTARHPIPSETEFLKRLGQYGCSFSIEEFASLLLGPVMSSPGFSFIQRQSSVYSVGLFPDNGAFMSPESEADLAAFLAALAQIEEPGHPGTPINYSRFSSHHWAAASSLASAHLSANQGVPFDEQRAVILRDKYFVCYLLTLLQRATIYRLQNNAAGLIDTSKADRNDVAALRRDALGFSLVGDWTELSSRDVINRYYEQCRQALRIVANMATVAAAISEFDAADRADAQQQTLHALQASQHEQHETLLALERTQNKVEWIEILIVGIYLAEFIHVIGEVAHLPGAFLTPSIIGGALAGMWLAHWVLRPSATGEDVNLPARRKTAIGLALACFFAWLAAVTVWRTQESAGLHAWQHSLEKRYDKRMSRLNGHRHRDSRLRRTESALQTAAEELAAHRLDTARGAIERADDAIRDLERTDE